MSSELSIKDKLFIEHILKHEFTENKPANTFSQALLLLGCGIIVYSLYFIGTHYNEKSFIEPALLLIIMGFITVGISLFLKRIYEMSRDQHMMCCIIHKLSKMNHLLEPGQENHPHLQF
ncbi:MAG TPA: hypothetical protein PLP19_11405 [bacterium]|nr:hypothetical protein [bacterium]HPN44088.1 hypothetical protein [bacterium]